MKASKNCLELIKRFEGLYLKAYTCPAGIWTIGYGHTRGIMSGMEINEMQAEIYLQEDLQAVERALNVLNLPVNQNQFDALCSFVYNVGIGSAPESKMGASGFLGSTMLKKIKAGDMAGAADEFGRWTKADGKILAGLVARRKAEADIFRLISN